jgi:hypothetical protein
LPEASGDIRFGGPKHNRLLQAVWGRLKFSALPAFADRHLSI